MLLTPQSTPPRLVNWLESWISTSKLAPGTQVKVEKLAGDGSTRTFFRVQWDTESRVLLFDPEWTLSQDYPAHQQYLADRHIPVPRFHHIDPKSGCLLMDDLGDELLQSRLTADPSRKKDWLRKATQLLAQFHGKTYPVPSTLPAASRRFDATKYFDELKFTEEHLSGKLLGLPPLSESDLKRIHAFCVELEKIEPIVLAHRDYHTRNLLVNGEKLFMIDFQDARLGPPHYDLASLLYDAYVPVSAEEKRELLDLYRKELSSYPVLYGKMSWEGMEEALAWVAFQRVVKAAGSFASFFTRFGKATHLPYLLPALHSATSLRDSHPRLANAVGGSVRLESWIPKVEKQEWKKS